MHIHLPVDAQSQQGQPPGTAIDLLAAGCDLSRTRCKQLMSCGAVWLSRGGAKPRRLRRASSIMRSGDILDVYYEPAVIDAVVAKPVMIAREAHYSVWYKPAGVYSQGTRFGDHHSISRLVSEQLKDEQCYLVHRLDRFTRGIILLAHSKQAQVALAGLFEARKIEKHYRAIVHGRIELQHSGQLVEEPIDGRAATSLISVLRAGNKASLVNVHLQTGRKHQARRHLAHLGHPIVGDRQYAVGQSSEHDLQLVAFSIAFECPLGAGKKRFQLNAEQYHAFEQSYEDLS